MSCTCSPSGCRTVRVVWCGLCVSFSRDQTWCACIYVPPVCIYLLMCKWRSLGFSPAATTQHHVLRRRKAQTKQEGKRVTDGQTDRLCSLPEAPDGHGRKKNERAEKKKKKDDMKKAKTRSWSFLRPMSGRGAFARRVVFSGRSRLRRTSFVCLSVCYTLLSRLHILPPSAPGVLHPATGRTFGAPNRPSSR